MKKLIAMILASGMLCLLFSACGTKDQQETYRYNMETLYTAEDTSLERYYNFRYYDQTLYAILVNYSDQNNITYQIVTVDLSAGENNILLDADQTKQLGTPGDIAFDDDGDMWILSQDENYIISKFSQGEIQSQIKINSPLPSESNGQQVLCIGSDSQFYIVHYYGAENDYRQTINVFTAEGEPLAEIQYDGAVYDVVSVQNSVYAVFADNNGYGATLATIDIGEKKLDIVSSLAQGMIFSSVASADMIGGQYCYYDLNGINVADSEGNSAPLLSWTDYGLSSMYPRRIFMTDAGDILCCSSMSIVKMKRVSADEADQRQVLTLAAFSPGDALKALVADFNRTNEDYMVSLIDYDLYNTDSSNYAGLNKLNTEIIGGNPPDMIDLRDIDAEQYIIKGILEDLYPYLDGDAEFERTDFLENVLDAMGDGDHLYGLTTTFRVNTVLAKTAEADLSSWNLAGLKEVIQTNPESFIGGTKTALLELACTYMQDNFVDWETSTASFDTPEFIAFLEACGTLPEETDIVDIYSLFFGDVEDHSVYAASNIGNFSDLQSYENIWGTDVSLIGYPEMGSTIGLRMYIGITAQSAHQDACWSFLRTALLSGAQEVSAEWAAGFPISKSSFEKMRSQATVQNENEIGEYGEYIILDGVTGEAYVQEQEQEQEPPTEEQVAKIADVATTIDRLASNNTVIKDIVLEEAALYFDGSKSAEKVAEVIQNRVQTYMNEQA